MKKFVSLCALLLCLTAAKATTVIVMDSTKALLNDVAVIAGTDTLFTSYDGRVVFKPEQLKGIDSLAFENQRFLPLKIATPVSGLTIVTLTAVPYTPPQHDDLLFEYEEEDGMFVAEEKVVGYGRVSAMKDTYYLRTSAKTKPSKHTKPAKHSEAMPMVEVETLGIVESANDLSAGRLTAGEVNDFAKWYFWPTVIDSTHKAHVKNWKLSPKHRFTVQVKNQAGYPIANYPVNLTDKQGNTVFQAVTDNTGKAELWNGLFGQTADVDQPEWMTIVVDEECQQPTANGQGPDVDVFFVFDATGSMGDELRYLQAEMKDVISRAKEATNGLNIRTGAVVYRDHGDEYITRLSRLTEEVETTKSFIDQQSAGGGGDYPEAVPEALMAAINSGGWDSNARARIAFLILDAPCHQDSATVALLHEQVLNAAAQGIRIVPVVCSGIEESAELLMRCIALVTNGTSFFLTDDSGIGDTHLKPTTDSLKVEHLNDMLVRTIVEFCTMPSCEESDIQYPISNDQFIPNPFDAKDLENNPDIPHGEGIHYLVDISGKLLGIMEGDIDHLPITNYQLPIGVYFIKSYYDGEWHTKKILVK